MKVSRRDFVSIPCTGILRFPHSQPIEVRLEKRQVQGLDLGRRRGVKSRSSNGSGLVAGAVGEGNGGETAISSDGASGVGISGVANAAGAGEGAMLVAAGEVWAASSRTSGHHSRVRIR